MSLFSTEFPVSSEISKADFAAAVMAWVRGINRARVLDNQDEFESYDDDVRLSNEVGEVFWVKSFESDDVVSFGARYEVPDNSERLWRTECTLTHQDGGSYLRVHGQCLKLSVDAQLITPLKPVVIEQVIESGWGAYDGLFRVSDKPHFLSEDEIEVATKVITGRATSSLAFVYVSRKNSGELPCDVGFLARKLSGVAHVVVEPSRGFSFELKQHVENRNPYAGGIGLFLPTGREAKRLFSFDGESPKALFDRIVEVMGQVSSSLVARHGWDWPKLQEAQSRRLREKAQEGDQQALQEYVDLFDTEILAKDERIRNLEIQLELAQSTGDLGEIQNEALIPNQLSQKIGPELFEGEFSDRLRRVLSASVNGSIENLDDRSKEFAIQFLKSTSYSGRASALVNRIKQASRDGKQASKKLGAILSDFGFSKSEDGKHIKYEPADNLFGVQTEVFPSTPSDSQRGGKNRGLEIIRHLGLNNLKD